MNDEQLRRAAAARSAGPDAGARRGGAVRAIAHRLRIGAALVLALGAAAAAAAAAPLRYEIYDGDGKLAGEQLVRDAGDGWTEVRYAHKDNGRGPEITERYRLAADGTLAEYHASGHGEMGNPVDEHFVRQGDGARWHGNADRGEASPQGPAQYLPVNGSFEPYSVALAALAARGGQPLPLLPAGRLVQRTLDELQLQGPGGTQAVRLVALTGVGFAPWLAWTTAQPQPRLFAVIAEGWLQVVQGGWAASLPELRRRQQAAERTLLADMAQRLRHRLPGVTVVRNARVFDSARAELTPPADVYLLRGRITAVRPAGTPGGEQPAQEIDAGGRVLLPGLFDMHGHIDPWEGALHLAAGVTTVRDMGSHNERMQRMLDDAAAGSVLLPRIEPCGFVEGVGPNASQLGIHVQTAAQARDAVDWYAARGYRQIKVYNSFPRALLPQLVAYAHERGLRVSGHVPYSLRASEVIAMGFDEVQHINQLMLDVLVKPDTDTRTLERFLLPARELADWRLDDPRLQALVQLMQQRHTVLDPTLTTFDFIRQRDGQTAAPYRAVAAHLPPDVQRGMRTGGLEAPDEATAQRHERSFQKMVDFVGRLYQAGITLVAGTDALAGFTLHSELEFYVQAGLTPAQALQVATRNAALVSGTADDRGRIAPGLLADLVLVEGDPTRDIGALRRVALVITQDALLVPAELHAALGVEPFVTQPPVLQRRPAAPARDTAAAGR